MDRIQPLKRSGHTSLQYGRAEREKKKSVFQYSAKLPATALVANAA